MLLPTLALSLVALALGPALFALGRNRGLAGALLDGLTLGLVPALVALKLLPHVVEEIGVSALALAAAGYLVVWAADRRSHDLEAKVGRSLIVPALVLHALGDGATLGLAAGHGAEPATPYLAVAVLSHRLPEGLFLASVLVPELGWRSSIIRIAVLGAATCVGAAVGHGALDALPDGAVEGLVAVGLGAMMRLVAHQHGGSKPTAAAKRVAAFGLALGGLVAVALPDPESVLAIAEHGEVTIASSFGPLFAAMAPAGLAAMLWHVATAASKEIRELPSGGDGIAGDLATAALDVSPALACLTLLGASSAIAVVVAALPVAAVAAFARRRRSEKPHPPAAATRARVWASVDALGAEWLAGAAVAAALEAFVPLDAIGGSAAPAVVVIATATVAIALAPSTAWLAAPLAVLVHKGLPVAAAIACLATLPRATRRATGELWRAQRRGAAIACTAALLAWGTAAGAAVMLLDDAVAATGLHGALTSAESPALLVAAIVFATLLGTSLVRRGPRPWLGQHPHVHHDDPAHHHDGEHGHETAAPPP